MEVLKQHQQQPTKIIRHIAQIIFLQIQILPHSLPIAMSNNTHYLCQILAAHNHVRYERYMDDAVVYANNKRELWETKMRIADFLHRELQLQINEKSTFLRPIAQGIPFLGFHVYPKLVRIQRKNWLRFCRKFRKRQMQYATGEINVEELTSSIASLVGHICQADSWRLRRDFLQRYEQDF